MINRREFLGVAASAGAAVALASDLLGALRKPELIQKAIPSSGETLPVVGLSFSNHPSCADHATLKEVIRTFADNGGRVFDVMHASNAASEQFHLTAPRELGIQSRLFWSTRGTPGGVAPQPGAAFVQSYLETLLTRLEMPRIDLVMLPPQTDPSHLAALKEEKKAGRVRYIGVQVITDVRFPDLESVMRKEPIDFIGVNYDVGARRAEETILPLAQERGIAVMAFFPFSNNAGVSCGSGRNLFARVGDRPVPEWAAEFDATTWAQFFLKYVISHPAVTVARVGTTKPSHMLDNIGGGVGRLPDEVTRKRMAAFVDALPALPPLPQNPAQVPGIALPAAVLDRYVGEYEAASGFVATFRRDGNRLWVKPGNNPEAPLNARSETRFQDPRGPIFEFQLDDKGNVAGAVLEQQGPQGVQRIQLTRR